VKVRFHIFTGVLSFRQKRDFNNLLGKSSSLVKNNKNSKVIERKENLIVDIKD